MPISIASSLNDTVTTNLVSAFNANIGASGEMEFYDGILPATCEDPDDGTLLATLSLDTTPFNAPSGNFFDMGTIIPSTVVADGTITYFRVKSGGGTVYLQGDAGTDPLRNIVFDNENVLIGDTVSVTSFEVTLTTGGP